MKEFLQVMRRFAWPYKKYMVWSILFNLLSAALNVFSFLSLLPLARREYHRSIFT